MRVPGARRWLCCWRRKGNETRLLARNAERAAELQADRENKRYLEGMIFPDVDVGAPRTADLRCRECRLCDHRGSIEL